MKRSMMCVGWTLGSAALFALGMGCSHEERPAQAPPVGTTSPTFESAVPPATPPAQPPAAQPPAPPPAPPPPTEPAAPPEETKRGVNEPAAPAGPSERSLCDAMANGATLRVEDVQNGVAIVAIPKGGHDLAQVRDDARKRSEEHTV